MRILIVNLRIGSGSVGRIVSDLYHGAIQNGHECKIAYARGGIGDIPENDTYRICDETEVKIHAGLTRLFGNTAFYFSRTTSRFCKWISQYNPDIVHLHGVYGYYLNMATLFSYLAEKNMRVISTLHSCWDFTGHCCYFDYSGCEQWKTGCKKCKQKASYPKSSFLDNTAYNYTRKKTAYDRLHRCTIVTPSEWLMKYVEKSFLGIHRIVVINNGVDRKAFHPYPSKTSKVSSIKPVIISVANIWDNRKGWNDIVELSYYCRDKAQLIVVGVSAEQKKALSEGTLAISRTESKEELAQLYSDATVFFNPTYEDNYPTVNLEAVSCHTPIVTYDTGGSPEIFKYGNWGRVIKKKDYGCLLDYAEKVFKKQIMFDFSNDSSLSNEKMVEKYISLYTDIEKND